MYITLFAEDVHFFDDFRDFEGFCRMRGQILRIFVDFVFGAPRKRARNVEIEKKHQVHETPIFCRKNEEHRLPNVHTYMGRREAYVESFPHG